MRKMHRKIYHMSRAAYREFDWVANRFLYIPQIHAHTHTHIYTHIYIYMYVYIRTSILYNEQYLHKFLNKSRGQPQQVQAQTRQTLRSLCSSSAGFTSSPPCSNLSPLQCINYDNNSWGFNKHLVFCGHFPPALSPLRTIQICKQLSTCHQLLLLFLLPIVVALVVVHEAVAAAAKLPLDCIVR